eukprot:321636-Rhodomonas_salina.1
MITPPHRERNDNATQRMAGARARHRIEVGEESQGPPTDSGPEDRASERQPEVGTEEKGDEGRLPPTTTVWEATLSQHAALARELKHRGLRIAYVTGEAYSLWRALANSGHPFFENRTPEE